MKRGLLIATAVSCALVAVGILALWVRTMFVSEYLHVRGFCTMGTTAGHAWIHILPVAMPITVDHTSHSPAFAWSDIVTFCRENYDTHVEMVGFMIGWGAAKPPTGAAVVILAAPLWFLMIFPILGFVQSLRLLRRRAPGLCPRCGYDLRATPERCPECGQLAAADVSSKR